MKRPYIIGVMGGGSATVEEIDAAYKLGRLIAEQGWILLNGGRAAGIMEASAKGANENGGLTVGILPDAGPVGTSDFIQIPIYTDMGNARNNINVLSSNIIVACPGGTGTISEIALALKNGKKVICLKFKPGDVFKTNEQQGMLFYANTPEEAINLIIINLKNIAHG